MPILKQNKIAAREVGPNCYRCTTRIEEDFTLVELNGLYMYVSGEAKKLADAIFQQKTQQKTQQQKTGGAEEEEMARLERFLQVMREKLDVIGPFLSQKIAESRDSSF